MARRRVQIAIRRKGESKWQLRAHGAGYSREEAQRIKHDRESCGDKVVILTMGKESD